MSSNFRQIRVLSTELAALERLKHQCLHYFSVTIDPILFKVGGYIDMLNIFMGSNFGQMGPLSMELAALEGLKNWCLHFFSVAINLILFKLANYEVMHKILDEFEFRLDLNTYCGISGPWVSEKEL